MSNKPKLSERFYYWLTGTKPNPNRKARRSYAAARVNNQNANWGTQPTSANWEQRMSQAALRARSRQAARDNGIVTNFMRIMQSNVIGWKGIRLQCRASFGDGRLKTELNRSVEAAWKDWGHAETCTISGKLDWKRLQKLVLKHTLRDGEYLVQMIDDPMNPYGFSLKVWDVNWLDETFNTTQPNGNRVIMSVEVDANDKPVAYWLTTPASDTNFVENRARTRTRIPAEQMIHSGFLCDDESQTRFVPWSHAGLLNLKNMEGYEGGVIQSARMAGNLFGFIEQDAIDGEEYTGQEGEDGTPSTPVIDVSNLSVNLLNPGQRWNQMDPKQPTQNHSAFMKTEGMQTGAAFGIPYFLMFGDWEATNYSSSRGGLGEAKQLWKDIQEFISETFCRRVYHEWLRRAWLAGKLNITAANYNELQNPRWIGRGWEYIDPMKDVKADEIRLQNRLATPSEILAEQGIDYTEFLDRWESDRKLAAAKGIDIDELYMPKNAVPEPANDPANAPDAGDDGEDQPKDETKRELLNGHAVLLN